jgi:hypothetical protein
MMLRTLDKKKRLYFYTNINNYIFNDYQNAHQFLI